MIEPRIHPIAQALRIPTTTRPNPTTRHAKKCETRVRTPDAPENVPGQVHLTKTEWAVLELLVRNPGRLVSGKQILHQIWGPSYHSQTNYLRFYLARLRQKLEPEPSHPRRLLTEPGVGYRFQP